MLKKKIRGQSTLEYAVLIAVVVAALIAIQIYMKRGVQGKLRESTDQIGKQFEANATYVEFHKKTSYASYQQVNNTTNTVDSGGETVTYVGRGPKDQEPLGRAEDRREWGTENVGAW